MKRANSLTIRLLLPLIGIALLASVVVSWTSREMGQQTAQQEVYDRFRSIEATVEQAGYPLTDSVIDSLAQLTDTDWITIDERGKIVGSTIGTLSVGEIAPVPYRATNETATINQEQFPTVVVGAKSYNALQFHRQPTAASLDKVSSVVVLFDESVVASAANRAAWPPLATGISTIVLLTLLMFAVSSRMIARLRKLQARVERVAEGDFTTSPPEGNNDEISHLAATINGMAEQLKELWEQVNRQQGEKLLHQISGGMAHQLRNTLTGARMAIELHRESCERGGEEIEVALRQLEIAEQFVHRLLTLGRQGIQGDEDRSELVSVSLDDLRMTHETIANHLQVKLSWQADEACSQARVASGAMFSAAVSNLILNAMQAGDSVKVSARVESNLCVVEVSDNGPGIDPQLERSLFEPFVTSRPEGMGLGLPLVRRAAAHLNGDVGWRRESEQTIFKFTCMITESH